MYTILSNNPVKNTEGSCVDANCTKSGQANFVDLFGRRPFQDCYGAFFAIGRSSISRHFQPRKCLRLSWRANKLKKMVAPSGNSTSPAGPFYCSRASRTRSRWLDTLPFPSQKLVDESGRRLRIQETGDAILLTVLAPRSGENIILRNIDSHRV